MKNTIITILAIQILYSCNAQDKLNWSQYLEEFNKDFQSELKSSNVAGASYAVFNSNETVWVDNYGFENKESNEKSKASSRYLIGSLTKVFTAVAVMQLYEDGLLDLDAPVTDYIPQFSINQRFPGSEPITVRSILTHHAGLPGDIFLHKFSANPTQFRDVLDYLNNSHTCFPVGKIKSYSNLGYALLGILIEEVSGLSYTEYVKDSIINPLEMYNTGFYLSVDNKDDFSLAYDRSGKAVLEYPIFDVPAGGIYSTVEDMVKFGQVFIGNNGSILRETTIDEMFRLQNKDIAADLDDRSAICFNFRNKAFDLGRVLEHGGATVYHKAQLYIAPDARLGAVMLSNSPDGVLNSWKLNEQVMVEYLKVNDNLPGKVNQTEKEVKFTSLEKKNLESFTGDYVMPGMICNFEWLNDNLYTTIQGNSFYITPEDDHSFVPAKRILGKLAKSKRAWFFLEEIDGEKLFIQSMPWGDLVIIGQNVKRSPIPVRWKERIGEYSIFNQGEDEIQMINSLEIKEKNGFLVLVYKYHDAFGNTSPVEMALDIKNDSEAFILGLGRGGGEAVTFHETQDQNYEVLTYLGLKAKKNPYYED
ncbi:MAG: serine hydrolase domain-containing protein [Bacteroidota bacterium]